MAVEWFVVMAVVLGAAAASADVDMPEIFSDHMVLQRELPVPIWGTAAPGEKVVVSFDGQRLETTAGDDGAWMVTLAPLTTSKVGKTLIVKGSNTVRFSDVLVGEVWLASGQSNMAGKFAPAKGRTLDASVFTKDHSGFRFSAKNGPWQRFNETTQANCSRVAYYFGMKLYEELGIPIGMINRATSGSPIQSWMSAEAAEAIRKQCRIPRHWRDPRNPDRAASQYDEWIEPILPVCFRGVIWYQGERNAKTLTGWEYDKLLAHLIETWRVTWAERSGTPLRSFPFYFVQVPTQTGPTDLTAEWPWLRDRMRRVLGSVDHTGMAVFYDYGPDLHPENKRVAGERLALWALAKDYGKDIVCSGPLLDQVRIDGGRAVLSFRYVGGGLRNKFGGKNLKFFEIAGKDGNYVDAKAWIEGDTVVVQSKDVPNPVYVRYLFRKAEPDPEVSLVNAEGLPASPFMTDDFEPKHRSFDIVKDAMRDWSREEFEQARKAAAEQKTKRQQRRSHAEAGSFSEAFLRQRTHAREQRRKSRSKQMRSIER